MALGNSSNIFSSICGGHDSEKKTTDEETATDTQRLFGEVDIRYLDQLAAENGNGTAVDDSVRNTRQCFHQVGWAPARKDLSLRILVAPKLCTAQSVCPRFSVLFQWGLLTASAEEVREWGKTMMAKRVHLSRTESLHGAHCSDLGDGCADLQAHHPSRRSNVLVRTEGRTIGGSAGRCAWGGEEKGASNLRVWFREYVHGSIFPHQTFHPGSVLHCATYLQQVWSDSWVYCMFKFYKPENGRNSFIYKAMTGSHAAEGPRRSRSRLADGK